MKCEHITDGLSCALTGRRCAALGAGGLHMQPCCDGFCPSRVDDVPHVAGMTKQAAWEDVRDKGRAILTYGGVEIYRDDAQEVGAYVMSGVVQGLFPVTDGGPYETILSKRSWENSNSGGWVKAYICSCKWGQYHSGSPGGGWQGRFCAHAYSVLLASNARAKGEFMNDRTAAAEWRRDEVDGEPCHVRDYDNGCRGIISKRKYWTLLDSYGNVVDEGREDSLASCKAACDLFASMRIAGVLFGPDDFYEGTKSVFTPCERPSGEPDYVSDSGSMYWYLDDGVVRGADHWGNNIGDCNWHMLGDDHYSAWFDENGVRYGYCPWEDFEANEKGEKMASTYHYLDGTPIEEGDEFKLEDGSVLTLVKDMGRFVTVRGEDGESWTTPPEYIFGDFERTAGVEGVDYVLVGGEPAYPGDIIEHDGYDYKIISLLDHDGVPSAQLEFTETGDVFDTYDDDVYEVDFSKAKLAYNVDYGAIGKMVEFGLDLHKNQFKNWRSLVDVQQDDDVRYYKDGLGMNEEDWQEGCRRIWEEISMTAKKATWFDYGVVTEVDPSWSGYDQSVAQGQLADFGEIYVDGFGTPIDDEYMLEDILMEKSGAKSAGIQPHVIEPGSDEMLNMEAVRDALAATWPESEFRIEDIYFDYGQGWKWTTIVIYANDGDSWQVLTPREFEMVCEGDVLGAIDSVKKDEYGLYEKYAAAEKASHLYNAPWVDGGDALFKSDDGITSAIEPRDGLYYWCSWHEWDDEPFAFGTCQTEGEAMEEVERALQSEWDSLPLGLDDDDIDDMYVQLVGGKQASFWATNNNEGYMHSFISYDDGCSAEAYESGDWFVYVDGRIAEGGIARDLESAQDAADEWHRANCGRGASRKADWGSDDDALKQIWEEHDRSWNDEGERHYAPWHQGQCPRCGVTMNISDEYGICYSCAKAEWEGECRYCHGPLGGNPVDGYCSEECRSKQLAPYRTEASRKSAQDYEVEIYDTLNGWDGWAEVLENADGVWGWEVMKYDSPSGFGGTRVDEFFGFDTPDEAFDDLWGQDRYIEAKRAGRRLEYEDDIVIVTNPDGGQDYKGEFDYCPYKEDFDDGDFEWDGEKYQSVSHPGYNLEVIASRRVADVDDWTNEYGDVWTKIYSDGYIGAVSNAPRTDQEMGASYVLSADDPFETTVAMGDAKDTLEARALCDEAHDMSAYGGKTAGWVEYPGHAVYEIDEHLDMDAWDDGDWFVYRDGEAVAEGTVSGIDEAKAKCEEWLDGNKTAGVDGWEIDGHGWRKSYGQGEFGECYGIVESIIGFRLWDGDVIVSSGGGHNPAEDMATCDAEAGIYLGGGGIGWFASKQAALPQEDIDLLAQNVYEAMAYFPELSGDDLLEEIFDQADKALRSWEFGVEPKDEDIYAIYDVVVDRLVSDGRLTASKQAQSEGAVRDIVNYIRQNDLQPNDYPSDYDMVFDYAVSLLQTYGVSDDDADWWVDEVTDEAMFQMQHGASRKAAYWSESGDGWWSCDFGRYVAADINELDGKFQWAVGYVNGDNAQTIAEGEADTLEQAKAACELYGKERGASKTAALGKKASRQLTYAELQELEDEIDGTELKNADRFKDGGVDYYGSL